LRILRVILFLVSILAGVAAGLYAGWALRPLPSDDFSPQALRQDYRTDYVLMTAEAYALDKDAAHAALRLARLGPDAPVRIVQEAILTGRTLGYPMQDLETMAYLSQALLTIAQATPEATP
jgi:hypothetical protein